MRRLKIIAVILVIGLTCFGIYKLYDKEEYSYYLVMGDYVSNTQTFNSEPVNSFASYVGEYLTKNKLVNEVSKGYLKNNMTSKKMLEMIEKDSYVENDESLVNLIKKSKYITITLGVNDIVNQIKYDTLKDKLIYDKEDIAHKVEIFKHNYHEIVEEIKDINDNAKVILVGCYNLYGDSEVSLLINEAIADIASGNNCYFVDVSDIRDKYMYQENELYLNKLGQEVISNKVINLISEIK